MNHRWTFTPSLFPLPVGFKRCRICGLIVDPRGHEYRADSVKHGDVDKLAD